MNNRIVGITQISNERPLALLSITNVLLQGVDHVVILLHNNIDKIEINLNRVQERFPNQISVYSVQSDEYLQEITSNILLEIVEPLKPNWIHFFDADEFIISNKYDLKAIVSKYQNYDAIRFTVNNYLSNYNFDESDPKSFLSLNKRVKSNTFSYYPPQILIREIMNHTMNYFDIPFLSKVLFKYSKDIWVQAGSHDILSAFPLRTANTSVNELEMVHLPLLTFGRLINRARQGEILQSSGFPLEHGWQSRMIFEFEKMGLLEEFWLRHSYRDSQTCDVSFEQNEQLPLLFERILDKVGSDILDELNVDQYSQETQLVSPFLITFDQYLSSLKRQRKISSQLINEKENKIQLLEKIASQNLTLKNEYENAQSLEINQRKEKDELDIQTLDQILSGIRNVSSTAVDLSNTKLFRLIHLLYRVRYQLFRGKDGPRQFFTWLFGRESNNYRAERNFNPIYQIINPLNELNNFVENQRKQLIPIFESINEQVELTNKQDIIILSVIDYDFRHQRPQHLALQFNALGHRVFYVNANFRQMFDGKRISNGLLNIVSLESDEILNIYSTYSIKVHSELEKQFKKMIFENKITDATVIVQYPNWFELSNNIRDEYGFKIVADYLDDYDGFKDTSSEKLSLNSQKMLIGADLVIATSEFLSNKALKYNSNTKIIRNGTEFEHFNKAVRNDKTDNKPIVGYFGAISDWFDVDKIIAISKRLPNVEIQLIGDVSINRSIFEKLPNVKLIGEVSYQKLPSYLESFDVCLIPFDTKTDLIKATNPVKFYEYLSAGKKIVATEIPELLPFKDQYVLLANDDDDFVDLIIECLEDRDKLVDIHKRIEFAKENSWQARTEEYYKEIEIMHPLVSIIILTYNQIDFTMKCLDSVFNNTTYPNFEVILVDNCSVDGTREYLMNVESQYNNVKLILNDKNYGFAQGNNIGINESVGDYIVLLNNDTILTYGWLNRMLNHFKDPLLGMICPVTNSIGNEAKINVTYEDEAGIETFAYEYTQRNINRSYDEIDVLAMFCVMIPRKVIKEVGLLESIYGLGMFEDDDYSYRIKDLGYRIACAEDAFVHHFGSASFSKMESAEFADLFENNKMIFEKKWGKKWHPHKYRPGIE